MGVFGGSFDPPHLGHVLVPTYLLARGLVDEVMVVPVFRHALGKASTPFETRLGWTVAAMAVHGAAVTVSDVERALARDLPGDRPSYSIEVLEGIARTRPDAELRLVVGSDILGETAQWHRWDDIQDHYDPIVVPRAGHADPAVCALPDISSTRLRAWLADPTAPGAREGLAANLPAAVAARLGPGAGLGRIWVVGQGNAGGHASTWLASRGALVDRVGARAFLGGASLPADAPDGIWILARDPDLETVAQALVGCLPEGVPVLHGAGARRSDQALAPLRDAGHPVGTLHPICSLRSATPAGTMHLGRAAFGIEGDDPAATLARTLVGDQPVVDLAGLSAESRRRYHAACALAANHMAVLQMAAAGVLEEEGAPPPLAREAIGALMDSALDNLRDLGVPDGVSGPAARGDWAAVQAHIDALPSDTGALYRTLSDALRQLLAAG